MNEQIALGMIETRGLVGLIEASDAAVKAAKVVAVDYERTGGGICIVKLRGTVGAVKAAVEAGAQAALKIGELVSSHVIPNPAGNIEPMITPTEPPTTRQAGKEFHRWRREKQSTAEKMTVHLVPGDEKLQNIISKMEESGIDSLDYNEVRYLARRIDGFPMPKSKIRNAGKRQIIEAIKSQRLEIVKP